MYRSINRRLRIEVETRTLEDVREVMASGKADRIMLDNFNPSLLVKLFQSFRKKLKQKQVVA